MRIRREVVAICFALIFYSGSVFRAHAQAAGWSTPLVLNNKSFFTDNPAMTIGRHGEVFVVWQCQDQGAGQSKTRLYFSTKIGQSWSAPVAITDTGKWDETPDLAVDTLGSLHVVWSESGSGQIYHMVFDGATWTPPENVSRDSGASYYPRIAVDSKNRLHVVWHDNSPGDWSIYYKRYDGSTWSTTFDVSDTLFPSTFPRIAIDSKDNIHVVFLCKTPPLHNNNIFYRGCRGGNWSSIARITIDSLQSDFPDVALSKNDVPVIMWGQELNPWPLRRVQSATYDGVKWSLPMSIQDTSESWLPSIAYDRWDNLHVVWQLYFRSAQSQTILYSSRINGVWSYPVTLPIPTVSTGCGLPSIKVDQNGSLHSIWVDWANELFYTTHGPVTEIRQTHVSTPKAITLWQNYPNPFNPYTTIRFAIDGQKWVTVKVFDVLGKEVRTLENRQLPQGEHTVNFDASDLSSGTYFLQLRCDGKILIRRMVLLR